MKHFKFIFFCLIFSGMSSFIVAQDIITMDESKVGEGKTIYTCNALFSNFKSSVGNYPNNQNAWVTLCPEQREASGSGIKIQFKSFQVRQSHDPAGLHSDTLLLFDGPDTLSPRLFIGQRNYFSDLDNPAPLDSTIFSTNPSGCFTFQFKSDANIVGKGWEIEVGCRFPLQQIVAEITDEYYLVDRQTHELIPRQFKIEKGKGDDTNYYKYIDICKDDSVVLNAKVSFPENNKFYPQDIENCEIKWDHGDHINYTNGTGSDFLSASQGYHTKMGYTFAVSVYDQEGAKGTDFVRVRIADNPIHELPPLPGVCTGNPFDLIVGYNQEISILPIKGTSNALERYIKKTFIPDGPSCGPKLCYDQTVKFTALGTGILEDASDICALCIKMDHSYVGDLTFKLSCPDNKASVYLKSSIWGSGQATTPGVRLGFPAGGASEYNKSPYDEGCNPDSNIAGDPWLYCWSENTKFSRGGTRVPMTKDNVTNYLVTANSPDHPDWAPFDDILDSTHYEDRYGFYQPEEPFNALVGCNLSGEWTLEICDNFQKDNGYIFEWFLNICSSKYDSWDYEVNVEKAEWTGEGITPISDLNAQVLHQDEGHYTYGVTLIDEYGCSYDTTTSQVVLKTPEVNLGHDTLMCDVGSLKLDAGGCDCPTNPYTYIWHPTGETSQIIYTDANLSKSQMFIAAVTNADGSTRCTATDTIRITVGERPLPHFMPDKIPMEGCEPFEITFENKSLHAESYVWDFGDGVYSGEVNPTHIYAAGVHPIVLHAFSKDGCKASFEENIHVFVTPKPDFFWEPTYPTIKDSKIQLINKTTPESDQNIYLWQIQTNKNKPGSLTYIPDSVSPFFQWNASGSEMAHGLYDVTLYASTINYSPLGHKYECIDSTSYQIRIINDFLQFPNVVTPNGDGINDVFKVSSLTDGMAYPNNELIIFDRFGRRVFYKKNIQFETDFWDPRSTNTAPGTYFYRFIGKGYQTDVEYKGSIEILYK